MRATRKLPTMGYHNGYMQWRRVWWWCPLVACLLLSSLQVGVVKAQKPHDADLSEGHGGVPPDTRWPQQGLGTSLPGGASLDRLFPDIPRGPRDDHITCPMRNKCQVQGREGLSYRDVNCFCDQLCEVYGDCCKDYDAGSAASASAARDSRVRITSKMYECQRLLDYDREVEVYMVNSCPKRYQDPEIIRQCQYDPDHHHDFFYKLPVSGAQSGILYKNYFCALCAQERNMSFWSVDIDCDHPPDGNVTANPAGYMDKIIQESSADWYRCHKKLSHPTIPPRKCKSAISRCLKNSARKLKKRCKKETAYVYAGKEVFKNRFCAQCNGVNDTYLSCEDTRTPSRGGPGDFDTQQHVSTFSLLMDFNNGRASIKDLRAGVSGERHVTIQFSDIKQCDGNHMYDPFAKACRLLNCPPDSHIQDGQCVIESSNPQQPGREPSVPNTGRPIIGPVINIPELPDLGFVTPPTIDGSFFDTHPTERIDNIDDIDAPPGCHRMRFDHTEYKMFMNGSLLVYPLNKMFTVMEYDIEGTMVHVCSQPATAQTPKRGNKNKNNNINNNNRNKKVKPKVLANTTHTMYMFQFDGMQDLVSFVSVLVSLVALLIMFIVYLMLPPLRNIAGKNIMCLVFCLFLAQSLFLVTVHLPDTKIPELCLGLGAAMHYFWLAAFFWLNVLAFDIWRTFVYRVNNKSSERGRICRFVAYSFYAWFMPAGIVAASLVLDFKLFDGVDDIYLPHYGKGSCWIVQKYALLFLFALPLAILLLTSIIFFFAAVINICRIARMAEVQNRGKDRCRLLIYIKLSLVMGLTWVFAFLAPLLEMELFWYLFIGFNAFQGLFICFAFVLNKKVFKLLSSKGRVSNRRQQNSDIRACSNGVRAGPGGSGSSANRSYFSDSSAKVIAQETSI